MIEGKGWSTVEPKVVEPVNDVAYVLERLFPSLDIVYKVPDVSYEVNATKIREVVFYGKQGAGKTTLMRWLAEKMQEKYVSVGCRTSYSQGNLYRLLNDSWGYEGEKVYSINMLCIDDLTAVPVNRELIPYLFKLRHMSMKLSGHNAGLVVMLIGTHDIFAIIKKMRIEPTFYFYKSVPINPADRAFARRLFGEELLAKFCERLTEGEVRGVPPSEVLWSDRDRAGMFNAGLATTDYLRVLD